VINNMDVKTILVTGATDGIGKQTAIELARQGAKVLVHGRDKVKGARVLDEINRDNCNENLVLYLADFSSFADIKRMAEEIKREQSELHVLINNAGTFSKKRLLTKDGLEMTFAVNHLATFLLTMLLLDLLKASRPARIVNVASGAHRNISAIDFDNLQGEKSYDGFEAYGLSKLGNVLFTNELARRLEGSGVSVNSLHPGVINTGLQRISYDLDGESVEEGARTSVYLAASPEVEGITGKYYSRMAEKNTSELAQDKALQEKFWKVSEDLLAGYL
jgi:NAD(P)-dependent dehydrogenase (short-subunit alcohol dehydrogenase family)